MLNRGQTLLGISSKGALDADMRDSFDGEVIVSYDKFESSWGQFGDIIVSKGSRGRLLSALHRFFFLINLGGVSCICICVQHSDTAIPLI